MASDNELTIVIRAKDFATKVMSKVGGVIRRINRTVVGGLKKVKNALLNVRTLLGVALAGAAVKTFTAFESGIAQVSTLVNTAEVDIGKLRDGIKQLSIDSGESFDTLNKGLFDTISAGVDAADSISFLGTATKLAIGGGTSTDQAIKGVVSLMNAYGLEAKDAAEISDSLFQAMKGGITTIGLMASNVGKVAPIARKAGLSMDEMNAAISALTKGGLSTEEAVTALRATLTSLIKPSDDAIAAARDLKLEWNSQILASQGLLGVLKQLSKDGIKPTVEQQAALAGSSRGFVGVAALAADGAKNLTDILDTMADKTGATDEAYAKVSETLERRLLQAWQAIKVAVLEVVGVFSDDLKAGAVAVRLWVQNNTGNIQRFTKVVRAAFRLMGAVLRDFFSPDGNNAKAAIKFWSTTMVDIWKAGLKILVEVAALGGKVVGRALLLALGEETRKGLNELARDMVDFFVSPLGKLIAKQLDIDLRGFTLFDESDTNIAEQALGDIKTAMESIRATGTALFDEVIGNLQEMKTEASPAVVAAINDMESSMVEFRDRWGETVKHAEALRDVIDETVNLTPLTGAGGPLAGLQILDGPGGGSGDPEKTAEQLRALQEIQRLVEISRLDGVQRTVAEIRHFYDDELARFQQMLDDKLISEQDFQRARNALNLEQNREIVEATKAEAENVSQLWADINQQTQDIITNNVTDFFTSIIAGTRTVKDAFKDLITGILQEISRLLIQKAVANIVTSVFGVTAAAKGAVWSGGFDAISSIPRFAKGGIARGPTLGVIGDNPSRVEAMVPLPDGRNIPVKMEGGAGAGEVNVNMTFQSLDPRTGADIFMQQKETIKGILVQALNSDPQVLNQLRTRVGGSR